MPQANILFQHTRHPNQIFYVTSGTIMKPWTAVKGYINQPDKLSLYKSPPIEFHNNEIEAPQAYCEAPVLPSKTFPPSCPTYFFFHFLFRFLP
jgi:hypothetical protein